MNKIFILTLLLLVSLVQTARSEELTVLTENLPPLNYVDNGQLVGPSIEIVREIQKRVGTNEPIHVYPWARAYKIALEEENVALIGTTHTKRREKLFKWVGPLAIKRDILVARKESGFVIRTLADAKKVERIGTLRDDTRGKLLESKGFTNLEPVSDEQKNAQKLALGRIDLWAYKKPGLITVCRLAGVDPNELEEVFHLRQIEVSIAFSLKTSDEIVSKWRQAFTTMLADGTVQRIQDKWKHEQ